jgi:hypothetical protein
VSRIVSVAFEGDTTFGTHASDRTTDTTADGAAQPSHDVALQVLHATTAVTTVGLRDDDVPITHRCATELVAMLKSGKIRSIDLLEAFLAQVSFFLPFFHFF